jgi:bacterioferritin
MVDLHEGIVYSESAWDFTSREVLRRILDSEEEHVDFRETQSDLIRQIGVKRYFQLNAALGLEQVAEPAAAAYA